MNRIELEAHISETYAVEADRPWAKYPEHLVFRHTGNRKWFALLMTVPRRALGLPGDGGLDIVNVKCDPLLAGSLREAPGIYPAYHMNKNLYSQPLNAVWPGLLPPLFVKFSCRASASAQRNGPRQT